jgi:hypothetical protein
VAARLAGGPDGQPKDPARLRLACGLLLPSAMRGFAMLLLLLPVVARANGKDVLRPAYTKALALVRAQPLPPHLQQEILGRMDQVKANVRRPGTRIEINSVYGKHAAMIELDHGEEASELAVSASDRDGHVITGLRDRLGWKFFPANAAGSSEILRIDRGYDRRGAEWYRIKDGQATRIEKAEGERLERAANQRWLQRELRQRGLR